MAQFKQRLPENKQWGAFRWKILLKFILTVAVLAVLWITLKRQEQDLADVWQVTTEKLTEGRVTWLVWMLVLVPVNWALESRKWQLLVSKVDKISFVMAVRSTLAGLLSGLALPAQIGDVVGRVSVLKIPDRTKTIGAALVSGGIQFYTAVFAGLWATCYAYERIQLSGLAFVTLVSLLFGLILFGFMVFFFRKQLMVKIPPSGGWLRVRSALEIISRYTHSELLVAFGVGSLRYVTYLAQFVAGLLLFEFPLSIPEMAACAALVLMIKTLMPALNLLGDLGLRGVSAVLIFTKFGISPDLVIAVTLLIWVTNILIPALAGLALVWRRELAGGE